MAVIYGWLRGGIEAERLIGWMGWLTAPMAVTVYGVCALTFMMIMYALQDRDRSFVLAFALGCVLSSIYGFLSGAWPFGVIELIWAGVAWRRYERAAPAPTP